MRFLYPKGVSCRVSFALLKPNRLDAGELDTELAAASKDRQVVKTKVDKRIGGKKERHSAAITTATKCLWACLVAVRHTL